MVTLTGRPIGYADRARTQPHTTTPHTLAALAHMPQDEHTFRRILEITGRLASSSDTEEVLGLIINALRDVLQADRASVFQYDERTHEFFATRAHGLGADLRLPADLGIIGEAGRCRQIINIPDAYADERFNPAVDKSTGYRTRCILTIPLTDFDDKLIGVAQVLNKHESAGGAFDERDEDIAGHIANQAAVALKRASLVQTQIQKEKMQADLEIAQKIQVSCLPDELPSFERYDIVGLSEAADETGGDAFDVIDLRPYSTVNGDALVFMADATGHGVGPALSVVQVLAMVRMAARLGAPVEQVAQQINEQLCHDLPVGRFVTSFVGSLDLNANRLRYISAGQAPLVFIGADGSVEVRNANCMPLGIDPDMHADDPEPFAFDRPGDRFLLLSDGYYEAAAPDGSLMGEQAIIDIVKANAGLPAAELLDLLRTEADAFSHHAPRGDDQTAVIIQRTA